MQVLVSSALVLLINAQRYLFCDKSYSHACIDLSVKYTSRGLVKACFVCDYRSLSALKHLQLNLNNA